MFKKTTLNVLLTLAILIHMPAYSMRDVVIPINHPEPELVRWQEARGENREWELFERWAWRYATASRDNLSIDEVQARYEHAHEALIFQSVTLPCCLALFGFFIVFFSIDPD